jgi:uncharacterized protein
LIVSFLTDEKRCDDIRNNANIIISKMENPIEKLIAYISTLKIK